MTTVLLLVGPVVAAFLTGLIGGFHRPWRAIAGALAWGASLATAVGVVGVTLSSVSVESLAVISERFLDMGICVIGAAAAGVVALVRSDQRLGTGFLAIGAYAVLWPSVLLTLATRAAPGDLFPVGTVAQALALHAAAVLITASIMVMFQRRRAMGLCCLLLMAGQCWVLGEVLRLGDWAAPDSLAQLFWIVYWLSIVATLGFAFRTLAASAQGFRHRLRHAVLRLAVPLAPIVVIWPSGA